MPDYDLEQLKKEILMILHLERLSDPEKPVRLDDFASQLAYEKVQIVQALLELNEADYIFAFVDADDFAIFDIHCFLTERGYQKLQQYYQ